MRELYSIGAAEHEQSRCRVCIFFLQDNCKNGRLCQYCHAPHAKDPRPDKKTRERAKMKEAKMKLAELEETRLAVLGPGDPSQAQSQAHQAEWARFQQREEELMREFE